MRPRWRPARSAPRHATRAASSTWNVPTTFTSKFVTGSATDWTTDPAAARCMTESIPTSALSSASASRMSPWASSTSAPVRWSRWPVNKLSKTRTVCPLAISRRTSVAPTNPAPPVTRTRLESVMTHKARGTHLVPWPTLFLSNASARAGRRGRRGPRGLTS